jgi:hypothetical protein
MERFEADLGHGTRVRRRRTRQAIVPRGVHVVTDGECRELCGGLARGRLANRHGRRHVVEVRCGEIAELGLD